MLILRLICVVCSPDVVVWTNTVVVTVLRVLLVKTVTFNTLMTIYVVTRW